jgi:hypothetical protein
MWELPSWQSLYGPDAIRLATASGGGPRGACRADDPGRDRGGGDRPAQVPASRLLSTPNCCTPLSTLPTSGHLFDLNELQRQRAESLGAKLLLDRTDDSNEPLYVLADPSGHPFCIFVA